MAPPSHRLLPRSPADWASSYSGLGLWSLKSVAPGALALQAVGAVHAWARRHIARGRVRRSTARRREWHAIPYTYKTSWLAAWALCGKRTSAATGPDPTLLGERDDNEAVAIRSSADLATIRSG